MPTLSQLISELPDKVSSLLAEGNDLAPYRPSHYEIQFRKVEAQRAFEQYIRRSEADLQAAIVAGKAYTGILPPKEKAKPPVPYLSDPVRRRNMIAMRLHVEVEKFPFPIFNTLLDDETVYVTVVRRGQGVMFTDNASEFPSDTLMTQLRLLL